MNEPTFRKKLDSVLLDNKYDRYVTRQKQGKLDMKSLSKVSYSDKLFKQRIERKGKHYNIVMLLDCSGSMNYGSGSTSKLDQLVKMMERFVPILQSHGSINLEIVGFNATCKTFKSFSDKKVETKKLSSDIYEFTSSSGIGEVYLCRDGGWGRTVGVVRTEQKKELQDLQAKMKSEGMLMHTDDHRGCSWNADGVAVRYAKDLLHSKKGEKIIMILSDGRPEFAELNDAYVSSIEKYSKLKYKEFPLEQEVAKCIREGITLMSIGILDDSVRRYYPNQNTSVIHRLDDMYPEIIRLFNRNLKRR